MAGTAASYVRIDTFSFSRQQNLLPLVCQHGSERLLTLCNALYMHLPNYIPLNITCRHHHTAHAFVYSRYVNSPLSTYASTSHV